MLSINMDDVVAVLKNCMPYLIAMAAALVVMILVVALAGKITKQQAGTKLLRGSTLVAFFTAIVVILNAVCYGPMSTLLDLVSGSGSISAESSAEASALTEDLTDEGITLLQNDDDLLPVEAGSNINVFGWSSISPVYGGTGSGAISADAELVTLLDGFENAGLKTNTELSDFYTQYLETRPELGYFEHNWTLPEPPAASYTDDMIANAKSFSDTAVVTISRLGGEFADLPTDMAFDSETETYTENSEDYQDFPEGSHYLEPSQSEKDLIKLVCENFDNVILVYNGANTLELGIADQYSQIKSVLWCAGPGQTGFNALGDIIAGNVNPSGHAADTFVYDLTKTPYFNNIGEFEYTGADDLSYEAEGFFTEGTTVPHFVDYVEDIYVGYKFYETAADEGLIDYAGTVQYPFGHGLSYTTFSQKMGNVTVADGKVSFDVTVTNTGDTAGKDVVQVYYNPPYVNGGIEKSSANLVTFEKTANLEPGASETVSISFGLEDMASYDADESKAYVLDKGDYVISVNADSHTELDSKTVTLDEKIVYDGDNARSSDATTATNHFDYAAGEGITYLSRENHFANYAEAVAAPTDYEMPASAKEGFHNSHNYDPEDYNDDSDEMPVTGAKNGLTLADLRGADYDDEQWDKLLDQMSVSDMDSLIALGGYQNVAVKSIGKTLVYDADGPASINNNFTGLSSIGFPSEVIIASTWNKDLAQKFGESIGRMANEMNVTGWYAPAMNTHRSAFDGRNFEYYSEDGVLAGHIAAYSIIGAQSRGLYAYMKHFAMNDQQIAQNEMLCTWAREQAIREIYLKPFEIAVKEGGSKAVMSSWNYIGNKWAGANSDLLQDVLRGEWGFQGMVITDGFHYTGYMDSDQAIRNGTDMMLKNFDVATNHVTDQKSATSVIAMRNACHNILYTVVNSHAYDPSVKTETPVWRVIAVVADVVLGLLLVGCEVLAVRRYLKRKSAEVTIVPR